MAYGDTYNDKLRQNMGISWDDYQLLRDGVDNISITGLGRTSPQDKAACESVQITTPPMPDILRNKFIQAGALFNFTFNHRGKKGYLAEGEPRESPTEYHLGTANNLGGYADKTLAPGNFASYDDANMAGIKLPDSAAEAAAAAEDKGKYRHNATRPDATNPPAKNELGNSPHHFRSNGVIQIAENIATDELDDPLDKSFGIAGWPSLGRIIDNGKSVSGQVGKISAGHDISTGTKANHTFTTSNYPVLDIIPTDFTVSRNYLLQIPLRHYASQRFFKTNGRFKESGYNFNTIYGSISIEIYFSSITQRGYHYGKGQFDTRCFIYDILSNTISDDFLIDSDTGIVTPPTSRNLADIYDGDDESGQGRSTTESSGKIKSLPGGTGNDGVSLTHKQGPAYLLAIPIQPGLSEDNGDGYRAGGSGGLSNYSLSYNVVTPFKGKRLSLETLDLFNNISGSVYIGGSVYSQGEFVDNFARPDQSNITIEIQHKTNGYVTYNYNTVKNNIDNYNANGKISCHPRATNRSSIPGYVSSGIALGLLGTYENDNYVPANGSSVFFFE